MEHVHLVSAYPCFPCLSCRRVACQCQVDLDDVAIGLFGSFLVGRVFRFMRRFCKIVPEWFPAFFFDDGFFCPAVGVARWN